MTIEEAKKALQQLKDEGESEEEILGGMYLMYQHDELTLDDLRTMTGLLGYEFTDEFEALSEEEKKNPKNAFSEKDDEAAEGVDEEEVEEAKEVETDDDKEMKKLFGLNDNDEKSEEKDEDEDEDEDDEEMKKLFGLDKSKKK